MARYLFTVATCSAELGETDPYEPLMAESCSSIFTKESKMSHCLSKRKKRTKAQTQTTCISSVAQRQRCSASNWSDELIHITKAGIHRVLVNICRPSLLL